MIDWQRFFENYGIEHVVGPGPNVRRGHIGISCPRCPADVATHFSVDVESGRVKGCWRDSTHWMNPAELIVALTGLGFKQAKELLDNDTELPSGTTPAAMLAELEKNTAAPKQLIQGFERQKLLPEFHPFRGEGRTEARFSSYMIKRGFKKPASTAREFSLHWASSGAFANRIIFPIWRQSGDRQRIVGWSARAITPSKSKYKAHPPGNAMERLLWESREMRGGDVLVVCEGPFDALKVACAANVTAVALLTNRAGPGKLGRIIDLGRMASRVVIILDRGAEAQALDLSSSLAVLRPELEFVPEPHKDPGDIPIPELKQWFAERRMIPRKD